MRAPFSGSKPFAASWFIKPLKVRICALGALQVYDSTPVFTKVLLDLARFSKIVKWLPLVNNNTIEIGH
jgi:hypothetical protein